MSRYTVMAFVFIPTGDPKRKLARVPVAIPGWVNFGILRHA